ncbi:MAG TPA: hypothetical protein VJX67_21255 [Blastocatellia bacterium]|nr:hypothetical protein [Blastocatellia bacterium]
MKSRITRTLAGFHWQQWLVLAGFLLAVTFTGWRVFHTVRSAASWHRRAAEPIRGWMTVDHVAHTYHVPPLILYRALGLPHNRKDKRPLRKIAKAQNRSVDQLRAILEQAITQARSGQGPPALRPSPSHRGPNTRGSP